MIFQYMSFFFFWLLLVPLSIIFQDFSMLAHVHLVNSLAASSSRVCVHRVLFTTPVIDTVIGSMICCEDHPFLRSHVSGPG